MSNFNRRPSIDASYQVSVHLAKRFQRRSLFRNRPIRNKNCMWRPCLLTDQDKMCHLYKGPSIYVSCQVLVVAMLVNRSERNQQSSQRTFHRCFLPSFGSFGQAVSEKIFKNRPIRNKNCLWRPCFVMDHNKMCTL